MLNQTLIIDTTLASLPELHPYFQDEDETEIMVNPGGAVFVQKKGITTLQQGVNVPEYKIDTAIKNIAAHNNEGAESNDISAIVSASFLGMRVSGALRPVAPDGSFLVIRKHLDPSRRPSIEQLIEWNSLTRQQADYLISAFTHPIEPANILVVGGTDSGKTTFANALLQKIPRHERVITIEDAAELHITNPNSMRVVTSVNAKISARDLVKNALRWSPNRLIIGESRGDETLDLLRAFNSGHPGSLTTIHANGALQGLSVMELMFQMSLPADANIPTEVSRKYIAGAIQIIVFLQCHYIPNADGGVKKERKVQQIVRLKEELVNHEYQFEIIH